MNRLKVFDSMNEVNQWADDNKDRIHVVDVSVSICIGSLNHYKVIAVIYQELVEVK